MQRNAGDWKIMVALVWCGALFFAAADLPVLLAGAKSDSKVKVGAKASKVDAAGKHVVTVTFAIDKNWHIYANPVGNSDLAETRTVITLKGKGNPQAKLDYQVAYPPGKVVQD